ALLNAAIRLGAGIFLLNAGAGAGTIAWVIPLSTLLSLVIFPLPVLRLLRQTPDVASPRLDPRFIGRQLLITPSFMVIHFFSLVDYQTDTFLISIMLSEAAVGWYGAAQTILLVFWIMPRAIRTALYPLMASYFTHAPDKLEILYDKSLQYLFIIALPMVVGVFLLAEPILFLIFGPSFAPSVPVLQWSIWGVIFVFLNVPSARLMLLYNRQSILARMTGISMATNVGLNLLLIPTYGIVGAAIARLFATVVFFASNYLYVQSNLMASVTVWRLMARPILATLLMALAVLLLRDLPLAIPILGGATVFFIASFALGVVPQEDWVYWRTLLRRVDFSK
ncbi:MAG: flippase, partial [Candidatus Promineifilaceae bacterium]